MEISVAARRSPGGVQDWDFIPSILSLCSAQSKWGARLGCLPGPVIFVLPIDHFTLMISLSAPSAVKFRNDSCSAAVKNADDFSLGLKVLGAMIDL
jgi:hypothetical protein